MSRSESRAFEMEFAIVLAALMLRGGAAATDFPFVTSSSPSGIRINESASLNCNYSGMALLFGDTVEWRKDGEIIASQGMVMPLWQKTVRVTFSVTTSVVDVTGLSLAAGGTYTCVVRKSCAGGVTCPLLAASLYLPIYGPPLAVAWQGAVDAPDGSQLELRPFDGPRPLTFDVYSLYNVSTSFVSVTLGGRNVTGEFTPAVVASGADLSVYNVSFTSSASLSQSAADGDVLNATIAVPLYPPMSATATIFVTATPNVSCPSEVQALQGDNLRVVCTVHSNPPARSFNWSSSGRTLLSGNDTVGDRATSLVIEESRNQYLVTLEIYNATNADFAVYSLEVANLMGISKKDVRFQPGVTAQTTAKISSGDSQHRLQWIILFVSVVIQAASQKAL